MEAVISSGERGGGHGETVTTVTPVSANHVAPPWELAAGCVVEPAPKLWFEPALLAILSNQSLMTAQLLTPLDKHGLSGSK